MSTIIHEMKHWGYSPSEEGVCHGLALAGAQACLRKDAQTYASRCDRISNNSLLPEEDLRPFFDTVYIYQGPDSMLPDVAKAIGMPGVQSQWSRITLFQPAEKDRVDAFYRIPKIALSSLFTFSLTELQTYLNTLRTWLSEKGIQARRAVTVCASAIVSP